MTGKQPQPISVPLRNSTPLSGLLVSPPAPRAAYVLAHGAGAGMSHPFMAAVAEHLAVHRVATLRYQFPYMDKGSRRPDSPAVAQEAVRAAVAEASRRLPNLPLFAGGKSFGGRMTSQAQAEAAMAGVRGLVFLGFPLHPAGRPSLDRARHLDSIHIPMLFLQGTRDALAQLELITQVVAGLGESATLKPVADADHSFHVPVRSGRTDAAVLAGLCDAIAAWIAVH